ncbi:MAG: thiamine pyrophosphate-binding protein [Myxococcales bacterium]|nr:thiamine pyrophosphate-binding protein [Myxococcales bacterium]
MSLSQNGPTTERHGGNFIAEVLARHGVRHLFVLCGGHISPILTGCEQAGIKVLDTRDEASAVFAAEAAARLTGVVGVAAVTAGPGVTNSLTAIKNAQMAQTPLILFGGATATLLKGRGSLQDIDQLSVLKPMTKWAVTVKTVPSLAGIVERAIDIATSGVPGPVFIEVPVDLLYPESVVRQWHAKELAGGDSVTEKAMGMYVQAHLYRQFNAPALAQLPRPHVPSMARLQQTGSITGVVAALATAKKPVLVIGSQALVNTKNAAPLARAVQALGIPVFLGGGARGLLGRSSATQFRHARGAALKEADVVIVAGFPFDFRMGYGRGINRKAVLIAANLSASELKKNRKPDMTLQMHAGQFLIELAEATPASARDQPEWSPWFKTLREREAARDREIAEQAKVVGPYVNPLDICLTIESLMADDAILVVDGGDFVATAAYTLRPRAPLSWLDPGVFGTLGVGGGYTLGAAASAPGREIWLIWGDGSSGYSLAEFDSFVRHGLAPIAIIGNDASWAQIARDQVEILGTSLGTDLVRTNYHKVAEGYGGVGLFIESPAQVKIVLAQAKKVAASGKPVCVNVLINATEFRKGSISI